MSHLALTADTPQSRHAVVFDGDDVPKGFHLPGEIGQPRREGPVYTVISTEASEDTLAQVRAESGGRVNANPLNLEDTLIELMKN